MSEVEAVVAVVYTTSGSTWGHPHATLASAKQECDEYLERCFSDNARPHVEDGTDEQGWFQFGEPPQRPYWQRYYITDERREPHRPQIIHEQVVKGGDPIAPLIDQARREGGVEALKAAADDTLAECPGDRQGQMCDSCRTTAKRLRDRAAGIRAAS